MTISPHYHNNQKKKKSQLRTRLALAAGLFAFSVVAMTNKNLGMDDLVSAYDCIVEKFSKNAQTIPDSSTKQQLPKYKK